MLFRQITDRRLAQYAYLIGCQKTKEALIIDPERDIDRYLEIVANEGLTLTAVAETHIHADFLSGARELAEQTGAKLYLSAEGEADGWGSNWAKDSTYDSLPRYGGVTFLRDGDTFMVGNIEIEAVHTPLNKSFNTAVGSLVTDPETPLVLIVDEADVEDAVRDLVRIGYDNVVGFVTPEVLADYFAGGNASASIPEIDFDEVERRREEDGVAVLDVRYASEYAAAHVPGAVNASYTRLPDYTDRVPAGKTLLVHCQSGARSAVAASYLAREGYDVRYVSDDFTDYAAEYETESGEPVAA